MEKIKYLVLFLVINLFGCGGGGGGDDTSAIQGENNNSEKTKKYVELALESKVNSVISKDEWEYLELTPYSSHQLNIVLSLLNDDVDLYVKSGSIPTLYDYDCRSNNAANSSEKCILNVNDQQTYYIGLYAKETSAFTLQASKNKIETNRVVLLLHGLASNPETWDQLVKDDSFFDNNCPIIVADENAITSSKINANGISCYNVEFGRYDRQSGYSSKGLDGKTCQLDRGCQGDYTSFDLLGKEIESVVGKIINKLGTNTEIILLGHSRGGLAARAFLQNDNQYKNHVVGLVTTGTPHQGSPLGRIYKYMNDNCIPKDAYRQDGSVCEDSWEVIEMFGFFREFELVKLDISAPSVGFLSPESESIISLNNNLVLLPSVTTGQLSYKGIKFGQLHKFYDLYDKNNNLELKGIGHHPDPSTMTYIENGQSRASYIGDGIVPVYSQQLSELLTDIGRDVDVKLNSSRDVLHTEQTSEVTNIYKVMKKIYSKIGWSTLANE